MPACRLANALLGLGLGKGERVAVLAYNCIEWMEIYVALAKAGLVAVPINFRLVGSEIRYIIEDSGATALIVEDHLMGPVEEIRADLPLDDKRYIHFGTERCAPGCQGYEGLILAGSEREPAVHVDLAERGP